MSNIHKKRIKCKICNKKWFSIQSETDIEDLEWFCPRCKGTFEIEVKQGTIIKNEPVIKTKE